MSERGPDETHRIANSGIARRHSTALDEWTADTLSDASISDDALRGLFMASTKLVGRIANEVQARGLWKAR